MRGWILAVAAAWALACSSDPSHSEFGGGGATGAGGSCTPSPAGGDKNLPCATLRCSSFCCYQSQESGPHCVPSLGKCPNPQILTQCDGPSDCPMGQSCCGRAATTFTSSCKAQCDADELTFCECASECGAGKSCNDVFWNGSTGYKSCG